MWNSLHLFNYKWQMAYSLLWLWLINSKKVKVAHTRLTSVGFRSWSRFLSQLAGDVNHKPDGRLPLLSARPAVTPATLKRAAANFAAWWTIGVNTLPKTVTRQHCNCDLNLGPSALESSTLITRLPSHPITHSHGSACKDVTTPIHILSLFV